MLLLRDFQNPACMIKDRTLCTRTCTWTVSGFHTSWLTRIKRLEIERLLKGTRKGDIVKTEKENAGWLSFLKLMVILQCAWLEQDFTH